MLTRKARTMLRSTPLAATVGEGQRLSEVVEGEALLIGLNEPAIVVLGDELLLDVSTTYLLEELGLPARLLHGVSQRSGVPDHLVVNFPYGLTGVYAIRRVDSPLAAAYRLMSRLGPMTRAGLTTTFNSSSPLGDSCATPPDHSPPLGAPPNEPRTPHPPHRTGAHHSAGYDYSCARARGTTCPGPRLGPPRRRARSLPNPTSTACRQRRPHRSIRRR